MNPGNIYIIRESGIKGIKGGYQSCSKIHVAAFSHLNGDFSKFFLQKNFQIAL